MKLSLMHVVLLLVMITIIIAVDILFFKDHFVPRLLVNIGIVLVFIAFFIRFYDR